MVQGKSLYNVLSFSSIPRFIFLNLFLWQYGCTCLEILLYAGYTIFPDLHRGGDEKAVVINYTSGESSE